jgi:hypothetical protein
MLLKDFHNVPGAPATAIACAGSTVADGTAIPANATFQEVTGADGTKGVVLPSGCDAGHTVIVYSSAATNALKIYSASGGKINNGSADAAFSATARKPVLLKLLDATSGANAWVALLGG